MNNTGNAYASYLLGTLSSSTVNEDSVVTSGARYRTYAWWVGDDWKVTRNLTLNLGLRHDIMLPYHEVVDRVSWFNPDIPNPVSSGSPGALQFGGEGQSPLYCNCSTRIKTHWNNWGPRVGFAYRVGDKTVLRAGYGIMYTRHGAVGGRGGAREGTGKLGYTAAPGFPSADTFSPAFNWDDGVPAYQRPPFFDSGLNAGFTTERPTAGTVSFDNPEEAARPPRYQNWNFSVQRAITPSLIADGGLCGRQRQAPAWWRRRHLVEPGSSSLSCARQSLDIAGKREHARPGASNHSRDPFAVCEFSWRLLTDAATFPAVRRPQLGLREPRKFELQLSADHGEQENVLRADVQYQSTLGAKPFPTR